MKSEIENEKKYILSNSLVEKNCLAEITMQYSGNTYTIEQCYLSKNKRIRMLKTYVKNGKSLHNPEIEYIYTNKKDIEGNKRLENEETIDEESWNKFQKKCKSSLRKNRFSFNYGEDKWDIDVFINGGKRFIIGECEMNEDKDVPTEIPPIIKENILKEIDCNDKRFNNAELSKRKNFSKLWEDILGK